MLIFDLIKKTKGKISYDDLSHINIFKDINSNINNLKEDLLQIEYPNNIIIDVGWYPSFDSKGTFYINIIKDFNWNSPVISEKCESFEELKGTLSNVIFFYNIKTTTNQGMNK
jgi:hypothetical protein